MESPERSPPPARIWVGRMFARPQPRSNPTTRRATLGVRGRDSTMIHPILSFPPGIAVEQGIADRDRHCATDRRTRPDQPRAPAFARAKRNEMAECCEAANILAVRSVRNVVDPP